MTAMDSVAYVLTVWVVALGVVLGAEKARREWVAKRVERTAIEGVAS